MKSPKKIDTIWGYFYGMKRPGGKFLQHIGIWL